VSPPPRRRQGSVARTAGSETGRRRQAQEALHNIPSVGTAYSGRVAPRARHGAMTSGTFRHQRPRYAFGCGAFKASPDGVSSGGGEGILLKDRPSGVSWSSVTGGVGMLAIGHRGTVRMVSATRCQ
jgi:hypothetical protein